MSLKKSEWTFSFMYNPKLKDLLPGIEVLSHPKITEITPKVKNCINEELLLGLRKLDYFARQKLLFCMDLLQGDEDEFEENLYRFVSLIDQVETDIKEKDFRNRLSNAACRLSTEKRKKLLNDLERDAE